eukprot:TRINITY_DN48095_c0_g1_i1.p1 TRINITY_DN48095_c0_g1~~TRINITY_DN48095_c0_g1_i1.p1  ORF type:complete len:554 (+),score=60.21 TRINITY_DN48095_c0_g1_i1:68-1663(+)
MAYSRSSVPSAARPTRAPHLQPPRPSGGLNPSTSADFRYLHPTVKAAPPQRPIPPWIQDRRTPRWGRGASASMPPAHRQRIAEPSSGAHDEVEDADVSSECDEDEDDDDEVDDVGEADCDRHQTQKQFGTSARRRHRRRRAVRRKRETEGEPPPGRVNKAVMAAHSAKGMKRVMESQLSEKLRAFKERWDLRMSLMAWFQSLPEPVQDVVVRNFDPKNHINRTTRKGVDRSKMDFKAKAFSITVLETWNELLEASGPKERQRASGFEYFCDIWKLDEATIDWFSRVEVEVQAAVLVEFDGAYPEPDAEPARLEHSDTVLIERLPPRFRELALRLALTHFGEVVSFEVLPSSTACRVRMSNAKEAALLVADMRNRIPMGLSAAVEVRYAPLGQESASDASLPLGALLTGTVVSWDAAQCTGQITWDGGGPAMLVAQDAIQDRSSLIEGAPVLFRAKAADADSSEEPASQYVIDLCLATPYRVAMHVNAATAGVAKCLRDFTRSVQARMEIVPRDVQLAPGGGLNPSHAPKSA